MKIFLVGYMYCGKTTIGKKLKRITGWDLVDTDVMIEEKVGMSVEDIFANYGEDFFRKQECEVLDALQERENLIISTGGGLPCFYDNMERINAIGKSIYLKMTPSQILSRFAHSKKPRPLLMRLNDEERLEYITKTLAIREGFYSKANITISALNLNDYILEITLNELLK